MNTMAWVGIAIQAVPLFFIVRTGISMIKNKSLN